MKFALLFLIYDKILHKKMIKFIKNFNIYIHPKYPEKINKNLDKYIIKNLIETQWAKISIVEASINLLKEAYKNIDNEWFILLSGDTIPVFKNYDTFIDKFNKIQNYRNLSIFNFIIKKDIYYKTSQWWILNRFDVSIILNNYNKYINKFIYFKNSKTFATAIDEIFFLSILKLENKDYIFINTNNMYTRWLKTLSVSPVIFNKITKNDIKDIKKEKSLFIRKITRDFSNKIYNNKRKLIFITFGILTNINDYLSLLSNTDVDFALIYFKNIDPEIFKNFIYIYKIKYINDSYQIIIEILKHHNIFKQWKDGLLFIPETFNIQYLNFDLNLLTLKKIKNDTFLTINMKPYYFNDNLNNVCIYITKKMLNKLYKTNELLL